MKTAVIGAGKMGQVHLRHLPELVDVVAVVDPHLEAARAAADGVGARAYEDMAPMLDAEKPEYVVVASPVRYHAEQTIAAFQAGAHVLCEKPLCMSVAEAEAMRAAAQRTRRLFTMGLQMRMSPVNQALQQFVAGGGLGEIYHTRMWGGHIMAYPWGRFFHRKEMSLGGVLAATTVHPLDAVYWILGAPEPMTASASMFRRLDRMPDPPINFEGRAADVDVEDFGHAHVRFQDGSSMSIEGNWLQHPRERAHGWEIHGVLGCIRDVEPYVALDRQREVTPLDLAIGDEPEDRTRAEHEAFLAAIRGERQPAVSWREATGVQRILSAIYESAERAGKCGCSGPCARRPHTDVGLPGPLRTGQQLRCFAAF